MRKGKQTLLIFGCASAVIAVLGGLSFGFSAEENLPRRPMKLEELQSYMDQSQTRAYVKRITCIYKEGDPNCPYLLVRLVAPDCEGMVSVEQLADVPEGLRGLSLTPGDMIVRQVSLLMNYSIWRGVDFQVRRPDELNVFAKTYVKDGKRTRAFESGQNMVLAMRNSRFPISIPRSTWEIHWSGKRGRKK